RRAADQRLFAGQGLQARDGAHLAEGAAARQADGAGQHGGGGALPHELRAGGEGDRPRAAAGGGAGETRRGARGSVADRRGGEARRRLAATGRERPAGDGRVSRRQRRREGMTPLLEVRDLDFAYGDVQVLRGVSLSVNAGEIVTLVGSNGAGKSTTLRNISRLLRPRAGAMVFDGHDLTRLAPHQVVALGVVHVPEARRVFPE